MYNPGWDFRLGKKIIIDVFATVCEIYLWTTD